MADSKKRTFNDGEVPGQPPKRLRPDYSSHGLITVLVGPGEKSYSVHKTTVCTASEYFSAACSKKWAEGVQGVIKLPDFDIETFDTFLHFAYTNDLDITLVAQDTTSPDIPPYQALAKVWGAADYLQNRHLRNLVIDKVIEKSLRRPMSLEPATLTAIDEVAPQGSTLRRVIQDFHLSITSVETFDKQAEEWPIELVREAARRHIAQQIKSPRHCPTVECRCEYHEHIDRESLCTDESDSDSDYDLKSDSDSDTSSDSE
ncbi:hypothetical protein DOTSEDRAFT_57062 [Dothistroma septosporum NZE10]|uniref:BTB domain-containing protein n=1 Tax=Dothistroma septosporum (strain NZE10 / CBS 128990) TaxID=675120 RepID=M2WI40_DOTSN|nr:hypothetical protein DOTSEDRAFT_57062 [Dothistroma septosporum NZE10]